MSISALVFCAYLSDRLRHFLHRRLSYLLIRSSLNFIECSSEDISSDTCFIDCIVSSIFCIILSIFSSDFFAVLLLASKPHISRFDSDAFLFASLSSVLGMDLDFFTFRSTEQSYSQLNCISFFRVTIFELHYVLQDFSTIHEVRMLFRDSCLFFICSIALSTVPSGPYLMLIVFPFTYTVFLYLPSMRSLFMPSLSTLSIPTLHSVSWCSSAGCACCCLGR